jgi:hypothetical protein
LAAPSLGPLKHAAAEARGDVGHNPSGSLGAYTGLCDRRTSDIAQRVDIFSTRRDAIERRL